MRLLAGLLVFGVGSLQAQVHELWRAGLTNSALPFKFYRLRDAAVDGEGNTIVGGGFTDSVLGFGSTSGFIAKFDSQGQKLWETRLGTNAYAGIDSVGVDAGGNVFVTVRLDPFGEGRSLALVKLSPGGAEQWRAVDTDILRTSMAESMGSAMKVDTAGNVSLTTLQVRGVPPEVVLTKQVVARFNTEGVNLWRTTLPGDHYFLLNEGAARPLTLMEDGGVVVSGAFSAVPPTSGLDLRGFVARLAEDGHLEWWTDQFKGEERPLFYSSVVIGPKGTICAAGDGSTILSGNGRALHTDMDVREVFDLQTKEGFLVYRLGNLAAINATGGRLRWVVGPRLSVGWNIAARRLGGWVLVGPAAASLSGLGFAAIDEGGAEIWRTEIPGYGLDGIFVPGAARYVVLRAADGTLRVIAPFGMFELSKGITVGAFQDE